MHRLVLLCVMSWISIASSQSSANLFGKSYVGDYTFYGAGSDAAGACSFGKSNSNSLPWSSDTQTTIALNQPQYGDSAPCGMCVQFEGLGSGLGLTPIPTSPQFGIINNVCPECKPGDCDLAINGDGRWLGRYTPVQCAVGETAFQYSFQGSNPYYIKLSITNTRVPIASVQLLTGGSYVTLQRTVDNYFQLFSGLPVAFPAQVRVTSIFGDVVQDTINTQSVTGPPVTGKAQFPLNPAYSTVGTPVSGTPNTTSTAPAPTTIQVPPTTTQSTPTSTSAPTSSSSGVLKAYDQCGGSGGTCSSHICVDGTWSDTTCPADYSCKRISQYYFQCQPGTNTATVEGLPQGCNRTSLIYESCGGEGDRCAETGQCYDAPWAGNCCITPGTSCQRLQRYYWQCLTNSTSTNSSTPPSTNSGSPANPTSTTQAAPSPSIPIIPQAEIIQPLPPADLSCRLSISPNQICGGIGGSCASLGICEDARAPGACCSSGYVCERQNEYIYTCARNTTTPVAGILTIGDNLQCGGLIVPDRTDVSKLQPIDGPWIGAQCLNGFVCQRYDAHYYACSGFPFVPPAVFNLTGVDDSGDPSVEGDNPGTPLDVAVALANTYA